MNEENIVTFYLHDKLRQKAMARQHNFTAKLNEVLTSAGLAVAYDDDSDAARLRAIVRPASSVHLMENPATARGLSALVLVKTGDQRGLARSVTEYPQRVARARLARLKRKRAPRWDARLRV